MTNVVLDLANRYERNPVLKGLVKLIPHGYGSAVDSVFSVALANYKKNKLKIFFDELGEGVILLDEKTIESNDFLHAFFNSLNYVEMSKSQDKIKAFANILKNLASGKIDSNEFQDYTAAFNELSEREFAMLIIKRRYEEEYNPVTKEELKGLNPKELLNKYWGKYRAEVIEKLKIPEDELNAMLGRLQRTGCYDILKGYYDGGGDFDGYTTPFFHRICEVISANPQ